MQLVLNDPPVRPQITPDHGISNQYMEFGAYTAVHTLLPPPASPGEKSKSERESGDVLPRVPVRLPPDAPPHIARFVQLSHQGLEMGVASHREVKGAHVPGKDIVVPTADENWKREFCPAVTPENADRPPPGGHTQDPAPFKVVFNTVGWCALEVFETSQDDIRDQRLKI